MSIKFLKKMLVVFRALLILVVLILLFWLFGKDFAGSGILVFRNDFCEKDKQISDLYPHVRIREKEQTHDGDWYQNIFIDPVYFKINPPREFNKAKVRIKYRILKQPFFQVGIKQGRGELDFKFATLEFKKLDELKWDKIRDGELVLYQRYKKYNWLRDFLNNLPTDGRIATYEIDLEILNSKEYQTTILNQKTDLDHVDYIIGKYKESEEDDDGWKVGEAEFEISRLNFEDGRLIFILSAPEININKGDVDISEIVVTLERPAFEFGNIFSELREYVRNWVDK